jgi:hypothetical protein
MKINKFYDSSRNAKDIFFNFDLTVLFKLEKTSCTVVSS